MSLSRATSWILSSQNQPDPPAPQWHSLPGGVLELGDTGFLIRLHLDPKVWAYSAHDPEGRQLMTGNHLGQMKTALEECAAWRTEFNPPAGGWKEWK